jgi:hypothetical protein
MQTVRADMDQQQFCRVFLVNARNIMTDFQGGVPYPVIVENYVRSQTDRVIAVAVARQIDEANAANSQAMSLNDFLAIQSMRCPSVFQTSAGMNSRRYGY